MARAICVAIALTCHAVAQAQPSDAKAEPGTLVIELSPGQDAASVEAAVRAATESGRAVTIRWVARAPTAGADASHVGDASTVTEPAEGIASTFATGLATVVGGLPAVPSALGTIRSRFGSGPHDGWWVGTVAVATFGLVVLTLLVRRVARRPVSADGQPVALHERARSASRSALAHLAVLGAFALCFAVAYRGLLSLDRDMAELAGECLRVATEIGVCLVLGDWLLSPNRPERRVVPIAHPGWHFSMFVAYGALTSVLTALYRLGAYAGVSVDALASMGFVNATLLAALNLVWFGIGRRDIADAFAGPAPGPVRHAAARAYPWVFMALTLSLWTFVCLSAALPGVSNWTAAARTTHVTALLLPLAAIGVHALAHAFVRRHETDGRPVIAAALAAGQVLATGVIWLIGLFAVTRLWAATFDGTDAAFVVRGLEALLDVGRSVVAGWALWSFVATLFRIHAPQIGSDLPGGEEAEAQATPATRLSTVLPLIRDVAFGLILAVTVLLLLSAAGIDITPLLAGFGVFGLAVSFGSQALVRDIVSGIFFIADDAFRIGEYIDTGKLKGTVERISLRSVRLRHQNGQFHTMPFGQMQSVTNFSRDWSVVKFDLRFDLGVDAERLRKVVKRIGLEMMDDPELSAQLLQPLKMQGIQDVTESAIVVRLKFTARPGNPSLVQREAMKRLIAAFRAEGIDLASNLVAARTLAQGGYSLPRPFPAAGNGAADNMANT